MLKKIIPIFIILCLVFSLTVPCFADSVKPFYYNQQAESFTFNVRFDSSGIPGWCTTTSNIPVVIGHIYYFKNFVSYPSNVRFLNRRGIYQPSYTVATVNSTVIGNNTSGYFFSFGLYFDDNSYVPTSLEYKFNIVDVTLLYGEGNEPTFSQFLQDYPLLSQQYMTFSKSNTLYFDNFYDPFLSFYSSLFHTFDFVPDLFSNVYVGLSVLIAAVVAILVVIFLVVFMIKRFTGGKT